jgi:putative ABC transport system permease protein
MVRSYLKIAWRNLNKNKLYAFINIAGLAVGIVSCLLIGLYIKHELSYDRFNDKADNIVRVAMEYSFGGTPQKVAVTGTKVGPQFRRTFPQVLDFVRLEKREAVVAYNGLLFKEKQVLYADSSFLDIFSYKLISGDAKTALSDPGKLIITESTSKKYFNTTDGVGKVLKIGTKDYMVAAVAADAPTNSQIQFDFIIPFYNLPAAKQPEAYDSANYITYLLLKDKTNLAELQSKITAYMKVVGGKDYSKSNYLTLFIEPLLSIHLQSVVPDGIEPGGSMTYIYIMVIVAVLILVIAGVNYVNLSIAQSANRSAEIGMRKVMGAAGSQIFRQFIGESVFITALSVLIAYGLAFLLLPFFNNLSGKTLDYTVLFNPVVMLFLVSLGFIIGFLAGAYPALLLSNVKIIKILKAGFSFTSGQTVRKSLIVFQFVISIFLMITTVVILQQLSYIRNKDIGYNKSNVLVLKTSYRMLPKVDGIKKMIRNIPGVENVAAANNEPINVGWGDAIHTNDGKRITVNALPMDEDFIKTMQLKIIAGTDFNHTDVLKEDTTNQYKNYRYSFMLNESAVKALGWTPEQAVGKQISKNMPGTIKAVVKDFNFKSFHESIGPLLIFLDHDQTQDLFVRVNGKNTASIVKTIGATWKEQVPEIPFEYKFLDDDYDALYRTEQRTANVFTLFSGLAIVLACLGLFAITAFSVVQRTKEIGIRKVLGARVSAIILLISKDFLWLVIIAAAIGSPIAWYMSKTWLQDFAYRITIHPWIFIVAGISCLVLAGITISFQAIKAAIANPVKSLRSE